MVRPSLALAIFLLLPAAAGPVLAAGTPGAGTTLALRAMPDFDDPDTDGDGSITPGEIAAFRADVPGPAPHAAIFRRIDVDGDGAITRGEYEAFRARDEARKQGRAQRDAGKGRHGRSKS